MNEQKDLTLAKLRRTFQDDKVTLGSFTHPMFQCKTVELPWLDNQTGISCIKAGLYKVVKHYSPTHGHCFKIMDVEGRKHILFHVANFVSELKGCVAVGYKHVDLNNDGVIDVSKSADTLKKMLQAMPNEFLLRIIDDFA